MWRAFGHRSARVISVSRLAFAAAFLAIVWADPGQPAPTAYTVTYAVLSAYVLWSALIAFITWSDWWLSLRLRKPAHIIDLMTFAATALLTEGLTSPFFTFFVFLVLAALLKFGGKAAALTAAAAIILYTAAGATSVLVGIADPEWDRFVLRRFYLLLLSLLLIWFGVNNRGVQRWRDRSEQADLDRLSSGPELAAKPLLDYACNRIGAKSGAFIWSCNEEPWVFFSMIGSDGFSEQRLGPEALHSIVHANLADHTFIFDVSRRRAVYSSQAGRLEPRIGLDPIDETVGIMLGCKQGLCIAVRADDISGTLILCDIEGICLDDLDRGRELGRDLQIVLDRVSIIGMSAAAASDRTRLSLARDVHDSVLQLLAAAGFRLEALRREASDPAVQQGIVELQEEFIAEQDDLREFIADLRSRAQPDEVSQSIGDLAKRLSARWNVECRVTGAPRELRLPARLRAQLNQLIREMVSNAVRHGRADQVTIALDREGDQLTLSVSDNGVGIQAALSSSGRPGDARPWSLDERVHELGGTLSLSSRSSGTVVTIGLQLEELS
jgi:signal transduction histidine kinase